MKNKLLAFALSLVLVNVFVLNTNAELGEVLEEAFEECSGGWVLVLQNYAPKDISGKLHYIIAGNDAIDFTVKAGTGLGARTWTNDSCPVEGRGGSTAKAIVDALDTASKKLIEQGAKFFGYEGPIPEAVTHAAGSWASLPTCFRSIELVYNGKTYFHKFGNGCANMYMQLKVVNKELVLKGKNSPDAQFETWNWGSITPIIIKI